MLPPELERPFSKEEARAVGISPRALSRLLEARLCRRCDDDCFELVAPVDEVRLALVGLGPEAVLSGESVAVHLGWPLPALPADVHLSVPRTSTRRTWPGAVVHSRRLVASDTCTFMGTRMTIPEVTAIDLAAAMSLRDAVVLLDAGLRKGNLTVKGLRRHLVRRLRHPGTTAAARAIRLSNRSRQSPLESEFRVLLHAAGLLAPVEQLEVRAAGVFVGRPDFAWPEQRVIAEIDGWEFHQSWEAFVKDRRRQNALVLDGWCVLRFTASDLRKRADNVVRDVSRALA